MEWTSNRSMMGLGRRSFRIVPAIIVCAMSALVDAADEPAETGKSRTPTASIRLPPRSNQAESASSSSRSRSSASSTGSLWTTIVSLGAIVSSLGVVGYWLRPHLGLAGGLPPEALELLGRRSIEQKVTIHLIRCGSKVLVVGVSPEGARTLSEITDPAEVQRLVAVCHAPREPRFSAMVPGASTLMGNRPNPQRTSSPAEDPRRG